MVARAFTLRACLSGFVCWAKDDTLVLNRNILPGFRFFNEKAVKEESKSFLSELVNFHWIIYEFFIETIFVNIIVSRVSVTSNSLTILHLLSSIFLRHLQVKKMDFCMFYTNFVQPFHTLLL